MVWITAGVVGIAVAAAIALTRGAPTLELERSPAVLRPADGAVVVAATEGVRLCLLTVFNGTRPEASSRVELAGKSKITWRWRVPTPTASRRGTVSVSCRESEHSDANPQRESRRLVVAGVARGADRGLVAGAIAATVARRSATSRTEFLQWGGLIVAIAGLAFVGRQLALAGAQIKAGNEQAAADRTAMLFERFRSVDFTLMWSRVGAHFLRINTMEEFLQRVNVFEEVPYAASRLPTAPIPEDEPEHKAATYAEVHHVINFHEEIGVLFNKEIIDREQVIRHFGGELVAHFVEAWWLIHWTRENRLMRPKYAAEPPSELQCETYVEWERMVQTIVGERRDLLPVPSEERRGQVWIVCLPPRLPSPEWERWCAVSRKLSCALADLPALAHALSKDGARPPHVRTDRVLCVAAWQEHRDHADELQDVASALAKYDLAGLEQLSANI